MSLIKGIDVILHEKKQVGTDELNNPIYEYGDGEIVHNVLVAPASSNDIINQQDLEGRKAIYTLAIPKGDTHNWEQARVEFLGKMWKQFGHPLIGIEKNIPLDWNMKVTVECYE